MIMAVFNPRTALRSPRDTLDGYIILPRLIDKVRAQARGELPAAYQRNLLHRGGTLDGRFLAFTGLEGGPCGRSFSPARRMSRWRNGLRNMRHDIPTKRNSGGLPTLRVIGPLVGSCSICNRPFLP